MADEPDIRIIFGVRDKTPVDVMELKKGGPLAVDTVWMTAASADHPTLRDARRTGRHMTVDASFKAKTVPVNLTSFVDTRYASLVDCLSRMTTLGALPPADIVPIKVRDTAFRVFPGDDADHVHVAICHNIMGFLKAHLLSLIRESASFRCVHCGTQDSEDNPLALIHRTLLLVREGNMLLINIARLTCQDVPCVANSFSWAASARECQPNAGTMFFARRVRQCGACQRYERVGEAKFNVCQGCWCEHYCSKTCQLTHWPIHKLICDAIIKVRDE